jgi:formiminotetrahydrofolate cyclodeaminase
MKAFKASKDSPDPSSATLPAVKNATLIPLGVAQKSREVKQWAGKLAPITNPKAASDLKVAEALATAAVTGAIENVEINLQDLADEAFVKQVRAKVSELRA